jgi:3-dehydroquinate synthetase
LCSRVKTPSDSLTQLESPNLHEIGLDRAIAFGHTWSPTLELAPALPLRHGHAITIDMCLSVVLAAQQGDLSEAERDEFLGCVHKVGLSMDHNALDQALLEKATEVRPLPPPLSCGC